MFNLPNFITKANLLSGSVGILYVSEYGAQYGFWFVAIAVFFDFFDGLAARKLGISGEMGKQLDSLADMVSFGVLPAITMFHHMEEQAAGDYLPYISLLIVAFSALRLAKFNIDTRQSDTFYGLPTPSNALFMVSLPWVDWWFINEPLVLAILVLLFCFFLVSEIRMFALKFKTWSFKDNMWKYAAMLAGLVTFILMGIPSIPIIIGFYLIFSIFRTFTKE